MADTKIGMKIEEEIKPLKELCEKIVKMATAELEKGAENIDTHEMYEVADIIKDLAEAKKDTVEACYKMTIAEAMEENADSYGEEWDEDGLIQRKGYNTRRYANGQYAPKGRGSYVGRRGYTEPMNYRLDMDLYKMNPNQLRRMDERYGLHYYEDADGGQMASRAQRMGDSGRNGMNGMNSMNESADRSANMYRKGYTDGVRESKSMDGERRVDRARRMYEEKHDQQSLNEWMDAIFAEIEEKMPMMDNTQKTLMKTKMQNKVSSIK